MFKSLREKLSGWFRKKPKEEVVETGKEKVKEKKIKEKVEKKPKKEPKVPAKKRNARMF